MSSRQSPEYLQKADEIKVQWRDRRIIPDLSEKYPNATEEALQEMERIVTETSPFQYISEGMRHVMFLVIGVAVALTLVYGIIQKKIVPAALKMLGYIIGCYYVYEVVEHYIHPGVAIPVMVAISIPAIMIIKRFAKNPKDVMIKPEAMQML
jgi:hypothetical protein